jgi:hypothetical protein
MKSLTATAMSIAVAVVSLLSGCGNGPIISTDAARAALESAGFHNLVVQHDLGVEEPTFDEIAEQRIAPFFARMRLVRFQSTALAKRAFSPDGGYSRAGLCALIAYWRHPPKLCKYCIDGSLRLPAGFEVRKVTSFRICTVILFSYNARLDPGLTARLNRAAAALRAKCH